MDGTLASAKLLPDGCQAHSRLVDAENLLGGKGSTGSAANPALGTSAFQTGLGSLQDPDGFLLG